MRILMIMVTFITVFMTVSCTHCPVHQKSKPVTTSFDLCFENHETKTTSFDLNKDSDRMRLLAFEIGYIQGNWALYRSLERYNISFTEDDKYYIIQYGLKDNFKGKAYDTDYDIKISKDLKKYIIVYPR